MANNQPTLNRLRDSFWPAFHGLSGYKLSTISDRFWNAYKNELQDEVDLISMKRGILLAQRQSNLIQPTAQAGQTSNTAPLFSTKENETSHVVVLSDAQKTLTPTESRALDREKKGELKSLTKDLWVTLVTCAVGAVVQGWSQQSLVGANLDWPADLHIAKKGGDGSLQYKHNGLIYFGLVNSIPYFAASVFGAWISDPITDRLGRRWALFFAALCSFAAPIGGYYSTTWKQLLVCRLVQGIGMGAKSSVVPILESEVSPPQMRGKLLVSWQTFVAVGIFLGASANCVFHKQWRLQFLVACLPALVLLSLCFVIPESPRWLIKERRYGQAYIVLKKLRETPLQATRDLYLIYAQLKVEESLSPDSDLTEEHIKSILDEPPRDVLRPWLPRKVLQLLTISRNRRAVYSSCIVMIAQQFSGINIYAFLADTIFSNSGIGGMSTFWFNLGFAAANALASASAFLFIDKFGRRTLLLLSLILMFPLLIGTGVCFHNENLNGAKTLIILYTVVYSPGAGVIPFIYSSEVFPIVHRQVGMSLAVSVNLSLAGAVAMAVPQYAGSLDTMKLLEVFAILDIFAAVMVWLFVRSPEEATSLEDMNFLFRWPTMSFLKYQISYVLFWAVKVPWQVLIEHHYKPKTSFVDWYDGRNNIAL